MKIIENREALLKLLGSESICAEIGVFTGVFSKTIYNTTNPKELILIDAWDSSILQPNEPTNSEADQHNQEIMDELYQQVCNWAKTKSNVKVIKATTPEIAKKYKDNYFDWVYIDANHYYDAVLTDLIAWYPKIKQGGYLCGHDYEKAPKAKRLFQVNDALEYFCNKKGLEITYLSKEEYGSWAIRRK